MLEKMVTGLSFNDLVQYIENIFQEDKAIDIWLDIDGVLIIDNNFTNLFYELSNIITKYQDKTCVRIITGRGFDMLDDSVRKNIAKYLKVTQDNFFYGFIDDTYSLNNMIKNKLRAILNTYTNKYMQNNIVLYLDDRLDVYPQYKNQLDRIMANKSIGININLLGYSNIYIRNYYASNLLEPKIQFTLNQFLERLYNIDQQLIYLEDYSIVNNIYDSTSYLFNLTQQGKEKISNSYSFNSFDNVFSLIKTGIYHTPQSIDFNVYNAIAELINKSETSNLFQFALEHLKSYNILQTANDLKLAMKSLFLNIIDNDKQMFNLFISTFLGYKSVYTIGLYSFYGLLRLSTDYWLMLKNIFFSHDIDPILMQCQQGGFDVEFINKTYLIGVSPMFDLISATVILLMHKSKQRKQVVQIDINQRRIQFIFYNNQNNQVTSFCWSQR